MSYRFSIEDGEANYPEMAVLYRRHYAEMQERLKRDGVEIAPYAPRLDAYFRAIRDKYLLCFVVRTDEGEAVGYSNIYLTNDMHNGEFIAREDTVYVLPAHRNGVGRRLVKHILADLQQRGVKRVMVTPITDLRVGKIWERMGFKPVAQVMTYTF